jgi:raffinose/stachyose/melibiose transport system permease protein
MADTTTKQVAGAAAAADVRRWHLLTRRPRSQDLRRASIGWLFALPALVFYLVFNFLPVVYSIIISFFNWDGIGTATWVGLKNYTRVFSDPDLFGSLIHAFYLIIFFAILPLAFGLVAASIVRTMNGRYSATLARIVLFLPQIIPGAAAGVAWIWMYSTDGVVNQILRVVGLGAIARPWLGDFDWAMTAVGFIGTWLETGFITLLLLSGIGKINPALYEAAQLDGAGFVQQVRHITLPGLRREIGVAVTVTIIASLAAFDTVYLATQGGPGTTTYVPGIAVYNLAFSGGHLGSASALAVVLAAVIIVVIVPLQRLFREN